MNLKRKCFFEWDYIAKKIARAHAIEDILIYFAISLLMIVLHNLKTSHYTQTIELLDNH